MTLAYVRTISSGSNTAACTRGSSGELVTLSNGTSLKRWVLSTGSQAGSTITVSSATAICMLTSSLVAIMSFGSSTVQIANLSSGAVTSVSSMDFCRSNIKPQQVAGDTSNGIALGIGYTDRTLVRFSSTGPTATLLNLSWAGVNLANNRPSAIVCKGSGTSRWIVGTDDRRILEIDDQGVVQQEYALPRTPVGFAKQNSSGGYKGIWTMHYHQGWLLVGCRDGLTYLMNHLTGECLQQVMVQRAYLDNGVLVSSDGGNICLSGQFENANGYSAVVEWDIFRTPMRQNGHLIGPNYGVIDMGFDSTTPWVAYAKDVSVLSLSGTRAIENQTSLIDSGSLAGEVIILDDSGSDATLMFHTPIGLGGQSVPCTDSISNILKAGSSGEGVSETFSLKRTSS